MNQLENLLNFVHRVEQNELSYTIEQTRVNALTVIVRYGPCEYLEADFLVNGHFEVQGHDLEIYYDKEAEKYLDKFFMNRGNEIED